MVEIEHRQGEGEKVGLIAVELDEAYDLLTDFANAFCQVFGFPNVVRFSWAPVRTVLKDSPEVANVEWSDDEEEDASAAANAAAAVGTAKLTSFFTAAPRSSADRAGGGGVAKKPRLGPFRNRKLALVEDF